MQALYFYDGLIGKYGICETDEALTRLWIGDRISFVPEGMEIKETPLLREAKKQLDAYFMRDIKGFDLPLAFTGTPFQMNVWELLRAIPYGQTITYGQLAVQAGRPKAYRPVGSANGNNPLPVIIPCHRVIGANGQLAGYTGGLKIKEILLQVEGITLTSR